jgi:N-acetylglucosaminyldiphosphoundecaprenol N-acetyl-beta-D-mannosaminyltransferase
MKNNKALIFDKISINYLSVNEFIAKVGRWSKSSEKRKIYYLNVHNLITAFNNLTYLDVLKKANLIYADGFGPVLILKLINNIKTERVNAADFIDRFFRSISRKKRIRLFLLGSEEEVVKETAKKISKKYKNIVLAGFCHGFFDSSQDLSVVTALKKAKPNLVLVGMGSPRQEIWIDRNYPKLPSAVYWSVGGLFHLMSGRRARAPLFMRNYSLEWLYRLSQEPRRLFLRYTMENLYFLLLLTKFFVIKIFQGRKH